MELLDEKAELLQSLRLIVLHKQGGRAAADALLEVLSPWDVLYLRQRACAIPLQFATWTDLPLEILSHISSYMSGNDLLRCRLASKLLRTALMQDMVLMRFMERNYPGAVEANQGRLPMEDVLLNTLHSYAVRIIPSSNKPRLWHDTLLETNQRLGGQSEDQLLVIRGASCASRADGMTMTGLALYGEGKIAWQTLDQSFCVWTLQGPHCLICRLPLDRRKAVPRLKVVALTSKLLIVSALSRPERLYILEFKSNRWLIVALSAPLHRCYAQSKSLIAVCHNRQAVFWSLDSPCVDIDTQGGESHATPDAWTRPMMHGQPGALFHPIREDVFFLVWIYKHDLIGQPWTGRNIFTIIVVKYRRLGNGQPFSPVRRFERSISHPICRQCGSGHSESVESENSSTPSSDEEAVPRVFMRVSDSMRKVNDYGAYSLFYFYLHCVDSASVFERCECYNPKWRSDHIRTLCFNVLTETFWEPGLSLMAARSRRDRLSEHLRSDNRGGIFRSSVRISDQVHIWNNEFLTILWPMYPYANLEAPMLVSTEVVPEAATSDELFQSVLLETDKWASEGRGFWNPDDHCRLFGDGKFLVTLACHRFLVHWCGQERGRRRVQFVEDENQEVEDDMTIGGRFEDDPSAKDAWFQMHSLHDLEEIPPAM